MAFEAKDYAISDILNKSVFDIPRNQRRYVWKKPHWQDLHEDIVFSITETKPHFVGSIVLEGEGKKDGLSYYTIIDGQQRLTTITIVLLAIMKHFHENDMTDDFLGTISYLQSKNNNWISSWKSTKKKIFSGKPTSPTTADGKMMRNMPGI